jgi:hypothetical protein
MTDSDLPCRAATGFHLPPSPRDARGMVRRVGVEVEFMGIAARDAAQALGAGLGGTVVEEDPHAFLVRGTPLGDLAVELDIRYVHPQAHEKDLPVRLGPRAAAWLGSALVGIVPRELITAPMPLDRLPKVDRAIDVLRRAGAAGRGTIWFGSLGLHFNVDPPRLDVAALAAMLRAFVLLDPWLRRESTKQGRGLWPAFLPAPYPADYVRRVAAPDYRPDLATFTADYLDANPTRDRGLDLLPILLHFDEARVRARLPYEKIGGRPVLHHRLPQARVGEPGWSIAPDWNRWVAVERLAEDPDRLAALACAYLGFGGTEAAWVRRASSIAFDAEAAEGCSLS